MLGVEVARGIILLLFLSLDAFIISLAYGMSAIRIPLMYVIIINLVSSVVLLMSMGFGLALRERIPSQWIRAICSLLLFFIGLYKIYQELCEKDKENNLVLLSFKSACILGFLLSVDGILTGTAMALTDMNPILISLLSLFVGVICMILGNYFGQGVKKKTSVQISWVGGLLLIVLAFVGII